MGRRSGGYRRFAGRLVSIARALLSVAFALYFIAVLLAFSVFGSADVLDVLGVIAGGLAADVLGRLA